MLAEAYKVARMDFHWADIETAKGVYNFSQYDALLAVMQAHGVRPYWILDYGNPLYPPAPPGPGAPNCSTPATCNATCPVVQKQPMRTCTADGVYYCCGAPGCGAIHECPGEPNLKACACDGKIQGNAGCDTPECIAAFGAFAEAAVARFKGHNIIFECLNEPNGMGHDSSADIAALCKSAGKAFTAAGELFVGPATAGIDFPYLNASMAAGILDAFGAVSVHPYRSLPPDTVLQDWVTLRSMIQQYGKTAAQKALPMMSGEWGYTSADDRCEYGNRCDAVTQGAYLARMWLSNLLAGATVSINYDWSDGSDDPGDCEGNFGSVNAISPGKPIVPKPKYTAALTLQRVLGDFTRFAGRVTPESIRPLSVLARDVFVLKFDNGTSGVTAPVGFAVWTNGSLVQGECDANHTSSVPVPERIDCGHLHIDEADCLSPDNPKGPGCCWEPCKAPGACPTVVGGPQCYKIERPVVGTATVIFPASPALTTDCFEVIDMLGRPASPSPRVYVDKFGSITVPLPTNGTAGHPLYLVRCA